MAVKAALFSTDADLRNQVGAVVGALGSVTIAMEVDLPFMDLEARHLDQLELINPELALVDLEGNPAIALKFAQFLVESNPGRKLIGFGPGLSPEVLLSAMQAGISEYVEKPVAEAALTDALDRVVRKLGKREAQESKGPGKMIAVFSPKGGDGATAVAANLAVEVHRLTRKKTLLVDLDLELGETALMLGIDPKFSMIDLLRNFHRVDSDLLASYIDRHESGLDVLAAPYAPAEVQTSDSERVRQILDFLRHSYDYVIVDVPKSLGPATSAAIEMADELFLVATPELPSIRNLTRSLALLREMRRTATDETLRLVLNRHDPRNLITVSETEKALGLPIYATVSNDFKAVSAAINAGKPVVEDSRSAFAQDVRRLAGLLTGVEIEEKPTRLSGIFPWRNNRTIRARRNGVPA